jgi:hypothetical protein
MRTQVMQGEKKTACLMDYHSDAPAHKYPRWIAFIDEQSKTATGSVQQSRPHHQVTGDLQGGT